MKTAVLFACLVAAVVAAPVPAREICTCQPLHTSSQLVKGYNDSLVACNRIAGDIERWRVAAFHRPDLADLFVDYEALGLSKKLGIQPSRNAEREHLRQLDYDVLSKFISKIRGSLPSWVPCRRDTVSSASTPFRTPDGHTAATLLVPPQRFRIFCQPGDTSYDVHVATPLRLVIVGFFLMAITWLCLFELLLDIWLRLAMSIKQR